jgi:hypothetical protein
MVVKKKYVGSYVTCAALTTGVVYNARNRPMMGYHSTNQGISTVLFVAILSEYGMYVRHQLNL